MSSVVRTLFKDHSRLIVIGLLSVLGSTVSAYITGKYMTTYALHTLHMPPDTAMLASVVSGIMTVVGAVVGGWLSDRFGQRFLMIGPRVLFLLIAYPAFSLIIINGTAGILLPAVGILVFLQAVSGAVILVALAQAFPSSINSAGLSIVFATAVAMFGGTAQFVVTWLLDFTGDPFAVAWYLIITNLITVVALFKLRPAT